MDRMGVAFSQHMCTVTALGILWFLIKSRKYLYDAITHSVTPYTYTLYLYNE